MGRAFLLMLVAVVTLSGCASKLDVSSSPPPTYQPENTMTYDADLDRTWEAAIKSISEKFFVLDNIQKDSRILTLTFSAQNPNDYIDCGTVTYTLSGGASGNGPTTFPGAIANIPLSAPDGTPHPKPGVRTARLEGKINIVLSPEGKNMTRATVNVRYVMSLKYEGQRYVHVGWNGMMMPYTTSSVMGFTTGQEGVSDSGILHCVTRYTLEKMILDGIKTKL